MRVGRDRSPVLGVEHFVMLLLWQLQPCGGGSVVHDAGCRLLIRVLRSVVLVCLQFTHNAKEEYESGIATKNTQQRKPLVTNYRRPLISVVALSVLSSVSVVATADCGRASLLLLLAATV